MDDTISRRSVIKEIDELLHTAKGESEHDLKMLRRVIKDMLPSAQQWIPVTPKTLPKKVGDYLVTTHSGQIARYIYMGNGSSKDYWMRCVLAWMPLPEPYKEEQP